MPSSVPHSQDIPAKTVLYVPGPEYPDGELLNEVGLPSTRATIDPTANGPDSGTGWYLSRHGVTEPLAKHEWLQIGAVWIGHCVVTGPEAPKQSKHRSPRAKRRDKMPSRAVNNLMREIEQELLSDISLAFSKLRKDTQSHTNQSENLCPVQKSTPQDG